MNRVFLFTAIVTAQVATLCPADLHSDNSPTYQVHAFDNAPVLDGVLDESAWAQAMVLSGFTAAYQPGSGGATTPADHQTRIRVGYTADALYVGIECLEPQPDQLVRGGNDGTRDIINGDCIQLFFLPDYAQHYTHLLIGADGTRWNGGPYLVRYLPFTQQSPTMELKNWRVATSRSADQYVLEVEIPFPVLGFVPTAGDAWRANFVRNIFAGNERQVSAWIDADLTYADSNAFGTLLFMDAVLSEAQAQTQAQQRLDQANLAMAQAEKLNAELQSEYVETLDRPDRSSLAEQVHAFNDELAALKEQLRTQRSTAKDLFVTAQALQVNAQNLVKRMRVRELLLEAEKLQPVSAATREPIPAFVRPDDRVSGPAQTQLKLIPTPQRVSLDGGTFEFDDPPALVLARADDADDLFAAQQLVNEVLADLGVRLAIKDAPGDGPVILIGRLGRDAAIDHAIRESAINVPENLGEQGYVLSVKPGRIVVASPGAAGVFYGVQTLKQLLRGNAQGAAIPCVTIVDWPRLQYRGWQEDVSRGPIPTMEQMKLQVRTLAEFKLNQFTLYTDGAVQLKRYPGIAPDDGITLEEIEQLVAYAKPYHVDVMGNYQAVKIGSAIAAGYAPAAADDQISPVDEAAYQFVSNVLAEIAPAYQSDFFHLNCDEFSALDNEANAELLDRLGPGGLYAYFISRLSRLLQPYGKTPMIWGDIAMRVPDVCLDELPKDLIIVTWWYGYLPSHDEFIRPFTEQGLRFYVSPGVSNWRRHWPRLQLAVPNICNFVRDGARYDAMGMLNTSWKDWGVTLSNTCWYPFLWGAECAWRPVLLPPGNEAEAQGLARHKQFAHCFDELFYGLEGDVVAQSAWDLDASFAPRGVDPLYQATFYEPVGPLSPAQAAADERMLRQLRNMILDLQSARLKTRFHGDSLEQQIFAAKRIEHLLQRRLAVTQLQNPRQAEQANAKLVELRTRALEMRAEYAHLWMQENRPHAINTGLAQFDKLIRQLSARLDPN